MRVHKAAPSSGDERQTVSPTALATRIASRLPGIADVTATVRSGHISLAGRPHLNPLRKRARTRQLLIPLRRQMHTVRAELVLAPLQAVAFAAHLPG